MHPKQAMQPMHVYEVRLRQSLRGADLISDALPYGPAHENTGAATTKHKETSPACAKGFHQLGSAMLG